MSEVNNSIKCKILYYNNVGYIPVTKVIELLQINFNTEDIIKQLIPLAVNLEEK